MGATELAAGVLIGARYRLERRIGEGGMGVVWAAEDIAASEHRALKLMKEVVGDPDARRRFLREGRAASAVRHPNVVGIFEVLDPADGSPAIVMELLEGESLGDLIAREHRLGFAALVEIVVPVVSAVGAAHALGIVHRDLKPENIFLSRGTTGERVVKVLDFGIAKLTALDGDAMRSTGLTTGAVLGTPAYMAPEQVFAEADIDHRADIWALGLILYRCLSGVLPTEGDNVGQVLKNVLSRPFEPLDRLVAGMPSEICGLVARMLARPRAERPADLREVFDVLNELARIECPRFGPPPSLIALAHTVRQRPGPGREPDSATVAVSRDHGRRSRVLAATVAAIALGGAGLAVWRWLRPDAAPSARPAAESPLASPSARLACPILRASGVPEPAGWLGAAAAATACERARVILGGRPERTLIPAELFDLPREPTDAFPRDPYGASGARDRSLTAARQRAQAYLDGEVSWSSAGFAITLALLRADGGELARSTGKGRGLYEAVRSAMTSLIGPDLIPRARALEPAIAAWARTDDIDAALGVLDLTFAVAHNAGGLPEECRRFEELGARVGELGLEGRWLCAYTLGLPTPSAVLDTTDRSDAGVATRIRLDFQIHQRSETGDAALLHAMFEREATPRGRAVLAGTESCLLGATDPPAARERAIVGVQTEPKSLEGGWCNPWEQLISLERDAVGADSTVRGIQAWIPWDSYGWLEPGFKAGEKDPATLAVLRRAYVLSPFDAQIADKLAGSLLARGDRGAVRGIAAALRAGGLPLHDIEANLLLVRVEASEARFGAALAQARDGARILRDDDGWIRAQRFETALHALELGILLGRGSELADLLVERFLDPDPPVLDNHFTSVPVWVPAICALASAPPRCFVRFRSLTQRLGAITRDTGDFMVGAERYVKRDLEGAARAWRPLLGGSMELASVLPGAMVEVFERTGASDLAERVDEEVMKRAQEFNGATLGHVRAARRAFARGDYKRARQLAEQVIKAWAVADEAPPALTEMRRLVAQLGER